MATNKEFNKLASQLSQLAKFYLSNLQGTPAEIAKKEKALLSHVKKSHQQLCVKGTALMRGTSSTKTFDDDGECTSGIKCPNGNCVPSADHCPPQE